MMMREQNKYHLLLSSNDEIILHRDASTYYPRQLKITPLTLIFPLS